MSHPDDSNTRLTLILTLWGLLFTKCFTLEFLVRHYDVPINSLNYVWALSIIMASVATIVYANIQTEDRSSLIKHPNFSVLLITGLVVTPLVAQSLLSSSEESFLLAFAAVGVGFSHIWRHLKKYQPSRIGIAFGWFGGAAAIFYSGQTFGFLIFGICIFSLSFLPGLFKVVTLRRQKSAKQPG